VTGIDGLEPYAGRGAAGRARSRAHLSGATPSGTQRRLQALMACGWSVPAIARATGMRPLQLARALGNGDSITPKLATAVREAYDKLWDRSPVFANEADRGLGAASAHLAHKSGWAPPQAWDDDQIDKPDGRPAEGWQPSARTTRRAAELIEDAQFVRTIGGYREGNMRVIADRLGVRQAQLEKAASRQRAAEQREHQLELG
jgi:hypothetical protein